MCQKHDKIGLKYLTVLTKLVIPICREGWRLKTRPTDCSSILSNKDLTSYTGISLSSTAQFHLLHPCCASFGIFWGIFLCNWSTDVELLCRLSLNTLQTWSKTVIHISWLPTPEIYAWSVFWIFQSHPQHQLSNLKYLCCALLKNRDVEGLPSTIIGNGCAIIWPRSNDSTPNPSKCVMMDDRSNNSVSHDVVLTKQWTRIYVWGI